MALGDPKPTILLVHGTWHPPKFYKQQLDLLEANGFPTSCPLQPSVGKLPPIGLKEDAQAIRDELTGLVDQDKEVIIVAHSYGGVVSSEAIDESFGKKARAAQGKAGGVIQILFIAGWIVPLGLSLGSMLGSPDALPPFIPTDEEGMCMMSDAENRFYNDLPVDQQKHWAEQLVKCPAIAQLTPLTYVAYAHHPCTYLFCEKDQGIPLFLQEKMIDTAEETYGVTFKRERCSSGHSPFLSQPETMLRVIEKIVA
ncbi:hypothetical protein H072_6324 [Dactylellina haptotyla CBS 200.50]|uniref:AB hydrolase-1 domain-containing protein n=1 Tax=Dactylellina haptotyla (strain CBS 200.50) TaxID=1284197 RepID=S8A9X9_DACHA|nr:hypothetical protein H072_6324 [Dactylellina haptotyla CBS 200.50]